MSGENCRFRAPKKGSPFLGGFDVSEPEENGLHPSLWLHFKDLTLFGFDGCRMTVLMVFLRGNPTR